MKLIKVIAFIVVGCHLLLFASTSLAAGNEQPPGPVPYLHSAVFEFPSVVDGAKVSHEFTLENKGTAPLKIKRIGSMCGCMAKQFSEEEIPPGGRDSFTLTLDTEGFGGMNINKEAIVFTNDAQNPELKVRMSGYVERFARISPERVVFKGLTGMALKALVTIVPDERYPFRITEAKAAEGENITFKLDEKEGPDGFSYRLKIQNVKKEKGQYDDVITLKTDNEAKPELVIKVFGKIIGRD